jgi:nucleotide-binding universal stress UspA family protein
VHHRDVAGDPAAALIEASNKSAAVVLGRGDAPAAALGSVCRALVQHAYCPVFLVG